MKFSAIFFFLLSAALLLMFPWMIVLLALAAIVWLGWRLLRTEAFWVLVACVFIAAAFRYH